MKAGSRLLMAALYDGNGDRIFTVNAYNSDAYVTNGYGTSSDVYTGVKFKDSYAYDRDMVIDALLVPNGITLGKAGMYELTGYINNVNAENTQVLMEFGSNGRFSNVYDYGVWRNSVDVKSARKTYYMYDGRGSVSGLTGQDGYDVVTYRYDIYGEETQSAATYNPYRYNGEYTDMSTGLQYLRARYYSAEITRFTSKDPVLGVATLPYTFNPYLYCLNNAINYFDPNGMFFKEIFGTVAGAAKGVWNAGKAVFDDDVTIKEGWQSGKAAGNWRGELWDNSITHNLDLQAELARQTGQAPLPYASSTGGVQMQDVYPQVMSSPADQIDYYTSSYEEHEEELKDLEETLASYDRQIEAASTQEEKMRLKEVQRRVEEEQKALCEEMHRERKYIAAGVNEIVSSVAPIIPGAGTLIGIVVKFANAGIYGSLGEDEKALVAGVSGGLDTVNLVVASIAFGQMYKNALTDAEIAVSNSAAVKGSGSSGKGGGANVQNNYKWGNKNTLVDHYTRHGSDVGAKSALDYAQIANEFYNNRANYQVKIDSNGVIRVYDPISNLFGSFNADGTTRTLFSPKRGQAYFDSQPGN